MLSCAAVDLRGSGQFYVPFSGTSRASGEGLRWREKLDAMEAVVNADTAAAEAPVEENKKRRLNDDNNGSSIVLSSEELKKLLEPLSKEQLITLLADA